MDHRYNIEHKICKSLEKNRRKYSRLGLGKMFIDLTPKAQSIKGKMDKLDLIKIKNFSSVKGTIKKMKR